MMGKRSRNEDLLARVAQQLQRGLIKRRAEINACDGRFPKRQLFLALNGCKRLLSETFGSPVTSRWSVAKRKTPSDILILEYLVDYGISRYSIPQAIRQPKRGSAELNSEQKYEILLAAESELGNDVEVARDFLKLLDVKSQLKCLIFRKRATHAKTKRLHDRLNWVLSHHKCFNSKDAILFVGLPRAKTARLDNDIDFRRVTDGKLHAIDS